MEMSHNPIFKNFSVTNILFFAKVPYTFHRQFMSEMKANYTQLKAYRY